MSSENPNPPDALHPQLGLDNEIALGDIGGLGGSPGYPSLMPSDKARTGSASRPPIICWGFPISFDMMANYAVGNGFKLDVAVTGEPVEKENLVEDGQDTADSKDIEDVENDLGDKQESLAEDGQDTAEPNNVEEAEDGSGGKQESLTQEAQDIADPNDVEVAGDDSGDKQESLTEEAQDIADPNDVEDAEEDSNHSVTSCGDGGDIDGPFQIHLDKIRYTINHINAMLQAELHEPFKSIFHFSTMSCWGEEGKTMMFCLFTNYHPTECFGAQLPKSVQLACKKIATGPAKWYVDGVSSDWDWDIQDTKWPDVLKMGLNNLGTVY